MIGGYIYNFGNKIKWSEPFSEFKIVVLSSDNDIITVLKNMADKQKIQNKPINLTVLETINSEKITNAQLIFIDQYNKRKYMSVFDKVEGKEVLLISENFEQKSYVMLNLYDKNDKLLFEINRPNIIKQHLLIDDEILLMGGTEIDIAEIYLKSQHSLREMELKLNSYTFKIDSMQTKYNETNNKNIELQKKISYHLDEIEKQSKVLEKQKNRINNDRKTISYQKNNLAKFRDQLKSLEDSLSHNETILNHQKSEIIQSKKVLKTTIKKIDIINKAIEEKNKIVSNKDKIIDYQKKRVRNLIFVTILFLLLIGFLIWAYRTNLRKNKLLQIQKQKIKDINEELNSYNEELTVTLEELKATQKQLIQSEKMASLGVLSAGIAHEINNPINFVYAGINSLLRDFEDIKLVLDEINNINLDSENLKEILEKIEEVKKENYFDEAYEAIPEIIKDIKIGADRTAEIVKGLRTFSRIDKGDMKLLDIHKGLDTSLLLLKNKYKNHVSIEKKYGEKIPELKCYPGKINQAFLNILSNAIDAIEDKGNIIISTKYLNDHIIISIKDDGKGMTEETRKKIFDPFFTTKEVGKGTGLGLSITYGIIQEHKGEIEIITEVNNGTEFIITIPVS